MTLFHISLVRIRIRKVPETEHLEGIDLRHYQFREGEVYEVGSRLGELLVVSGYADPARRRTDFDKAADKDRRRH